MLAVFRQGIAVPLVVLTSIVSLLVIFIGVEQPYIVEFTIVAWLAGAEPILISRRVSAIFTSESFLVRHALRRTVKVPLKGVKRAYIDLGPATGEERPRLRIQLLVGGEVEFEVPDLEAVVYLLNTGAGTGLQTTPFAAKTEVGS